MNPTSRARLKLVLLAVLFFAPVIGAIGIFFYAPEWFSGRVNYGTLVSPARPVPDLALADAAGAPAPEALRHKWSLVYLARATCDETCNARLVLTRQVRLALNEKRVRVQRVYVAPDAAAAARAKAELSAEHPDLVVVVGAGPAAQDFFQPTDPQALYLLDPLGNWLMVYTGVVEHKGLHRDLKKLLRISQVG
jgi:cytochrome oxidase Cu insertion factor (SCO1/SenC/PrrC family)